MSFEDFRPGSAMRHAEIRRRRFGRDALPHVSQMP